MTSTTRPSTGRVLVAVVAVAGVVALATGFLTGPGTTVAPDSPRSTATAPYRDASLPIDERVADLLGRMSLEEKVGQMTQAERADIADDPSLITEYGLGSLLSGGGSVPEENTAEAWADMVDSYQRAALGTRLGIPLLYGVDSVHGHANLLGATVFPHNIGLGATRDRRLVEKINQLTAKETRATGPNWNFAPCLCVARDDRWGRTYESFGESPALVRSMGVAIDGLQGRPRRLDQPDRMLATAKHFAGDGLTSFGTGEGDYTVDQGIAEVSRPTFRRLALAPYLRAVNEHDVGAVMPSFSSVDWTGDGLGNPTKMSASRPLLTGWLKKRHGFEGIVLSDWRAIRQIPGSYEDQVRISVNAGMDMFMEPYSGSDTGWREFIATLTGLVESGDVPVARIDDAVSRILAAKFELGLFEEAMTPRTHAGAIGSRAHRQVARTAVAKSQVLLRNTRRTLPLSADAGRIYVAGSNADTIGNQAGGWTLTWQGGSTHVLPGETVLDGIRAAAGGAVSFDETADSTIPRSADGVIVVGETPYAEGFGDVGGPRWADDPGDGGQPRPEKTMRLSAADERAIRTVCARAATCTVVVVSGRPLVMPSRIRRQSDAIVASWLPGSEGGGVADVLFGRRPFTGRLPVSWPRRVGEPVDVGDPDADPLYPYGHGLTTGSAD